MQSVVIAYVATALVFAVADGVWLSTVGASFYRPRLAGLVSDGVVWGPAIAFYLLFIAGVLYFAVMPAIEQGRWSQALLRGALFGFFAYMTYDLTNWATLKGWPGSVALLDMAWGTVLTAVAAAAGTAITLAVLRATGSAAG
jgi:uncharacterized membrane protein